MVTHPDWVLNPVQQGLTSINGVEPVFPFSASCTPITDNVFIVWSQNSYSILILTTLFCTLRLGFFLQSVPLWGTLWPVNDMSEISHGIKYLTFEVFGLIIKVINEIRIYYVIKWYN